MNCTKNQNFTIYIYNMYTSNLLKFKQILARSQFSHTTLPFFFSLPIHIWRPTPLFSIYLGVNTLEDLNIMLCFWWFI